ncbi:hypothetical protein Caci_7664 [Catenulispora acidiphila DSM 44928]|uniref:PBP domain-containing protein n=1 Tax=Catenulispora acidiphila (strain DSM 44928 / JCM 14897 / NBRC 102108 / NRRL B-24433 / ID139908) TaxID=479433 RepID=C7QCM5_CATAD|nr:hypothetical protein [Catenulispora acidiphila]ACU76488.1 hypothetical protein Caci_7664 [Catenulispora acidiphila DSM 44928]
MSPREAGLRRRPGLRAYCAAVLAWTVTFMTALVLLPPSAHTTAVAHADSTSVTVQGPQRYDPGTGALGAHGTVTVSQTRNLVDQMVHVSWTGFTPSTDGAYVVVGQSGSWNVVHYPVVVYECRGADPKITDCYGSYHYGQSADDTNGEGFVQPAVGPGLQAPDYPTNEQGAVTAGDATGGLDLEVYTASQAPSLGCDAAHQCSIVVEPNYGGDALGFNTADGSANCADHSADAGLGGEATNVTFGSVDYTGTGSQSGEQCAWNYRTVVPIDFAPVPGSCAASATDVVAEGMPMLDRALTQWVVGSCLAGNTPVTVNASTDLTEPEARGDFLAGAPGADVAFTSLPADPAAKSARPYTYVPVGNTGIAIAFFVDDPVTGLPIRTMNLDARLVAKLLTQSYDLEYVPGLLSDTASVAGNPSCIFADPEFLALNPTGGAFTWPSCQDVTALNTLPIVAGGKTDLVRELTTWIMSDPDARSFLAGSPDPWKMHVDTFYRSSKYPYPIDSLITQDSSGPPLDPATGKPVDPAGGHRDYGHLKGFEWNPIQSGLDEVLRHLITATPTCITPDYDPAVGGHGKCAAEHIGSRGVLAIMDTGRAAAFDLPAASLKNAAGAYVAPTAPAMAAAASDFVTDPATGTQSLQWGNAGPAYAGDAAAYPLTVPAYAMAPTSGVSAAKAASVANFLAAVTDNRSGQLSGQAPGELAPGYVADTAVQSVQAGVALTKIRAAAGPAGPASTVTATGPPTTSGNQVLTPVTVSKNGTTSVSYLTSTLGGGTGGTGGIGGTGSGGSGSSSKGAVAGGSSGPTRSITGSTAAASVGSAKADTAGFGRLVLPILLIVGLVLMAAGPAALMLSSGTAGARIRALWPRSSRRFGR